MKASLWLFTLGLAIVSTACWAVAHLLFLSWQRKFPDMPLPTFTQLVLLPHSWLLWCPVPWVCCATALSLRKQITPGACLVFGGTVFLAMSVIASAVVVAGLLPYALPPIF